MQFIRPTLALALGAIAVQAQSSGERLVAPSFLARVILTLLSLCSVVQLQFCLD